MSEYSEELMKRAGLEKSSRSVRIPTKRVNGESFYGKKYSYYEIPSKEQLEKAGFDEYADLIETKKGYYAVAGSNEKEKKKREALLAEIAQDPKKVADLTKEERIFLVGRGYEREKDERPQYAKILDDIYGKFTEGKEIDPFWTGPKPVFKKVVYPWESQNKLKKQ